MAAKSSLSSNFLAKPRRKRKGVHSKKKNSVHKGAKNYNKKYVGQGK